jgi:hypothetical protein
VIPSVAALFWTVGEAIKKGSGVVFFLSETRLSATLSASASYLSFDLPILSFACTPKKSSPFLALKEDEEEGFDFAIWLNAGI